jgi:23S rRNA pseudouridine1911/1915/1917 synthase
MLMLKAPTVIFNDDHLVVINKPAGLPVVAKKGASLMNFVHEHFGKELANVHRLDEEASGLVLCAKTKSALDYLSGQFQSKTVDASFLAFCALETNPEKLAVLKHVVRDSLGRLPESFEIELPLEEDDLKPGVMKIAKRKQGISALSRVRVLKMFGSWAWIECKPVTARTHQLRVHLSAIGAAILNDHVYGTRGVQLLLSDLKKRYKGRDEEKPLIEQLALHSSRLVINHPATREPIAFDAPLPHEFEIAFKYLRKFLTKE